MSGMEEYRPGSALPGANMHTTALCSPIAQQ